jgi:hypothetical protein
MWYTGIWGYGATWLGVQIGYATSPDGISWTKDPANPMDVLGDYVEQAYVLLHPHRHECEMFYGNPTNYEFVINRATSSCRAFAQVRRSSGRRLHSK